MKENLFHTTLWDSLHELSCVSISGTLGGLFSQILQGEDIVRERAIKFLSTKLKTLPEEVLTKEVEEFILTESKKVSVTTCF